jgi:hypothetical protein
VSKKISFGTKPSTRLPPPEADKWVNSRVVEEDEVPPVQRHEPKPEIAEPEKMKRLTIDIPLSLHKQLKAQCALSGRTIADEVREFLLQKYGKS